MIISEEFYGERTLYDIPAANYDRFVKEIAKLSRKSEKLVGESITPMIISSHMDGKVLIHSVHLATAKPVMNGWTFVARIDHTNESGNIIRSVPNTPELPVHYRDASSDCAHCNVRRMRRDTFVVRNDETHEFKQVGSTCLQDFFGHDPYKIAKLAEVLGYASDVARASTERGDMVLTDRRWINLETFLLCTAKTVMTRGWVSKVAASNTGQSSTRFLAEEMYDIGEHNFSEAHHTLVEGALEWANSLAADPKNDYEHNVAVVAASPFCERRSLGIAASIIGVFYDRQRRASVSTTNVGDMTGLKNLLQTARNSGLKYPKLSLTVEGSPVVISLAGDRSAHPGTVNITDGGSYGDNVWYGRVNADGQWSPSRAVNADRMISLTVLLTALSNDPVATARKWGHLTGNCMFCNIPLKDERSTNVGYGKTCAKNWGLPWG